MAYHSHYGTAFGSGEVKGRFAATKDEQPKGKEVPLPKDDGMGQGHVGAAAEEIADVAQHLRRASDRN